MTKEYTNIKYETYRNYIPEGFYTIKEVERILFVMRQAKERTDQLLYESMKWTKIKEE